MWYTGLVNVDICSNDWVGPCGDNTTAIDNSGALIDRLVYPWGIYGVNYSKEEEEEIGDWDVLGRDDPDIEDAIEFQLVENDPPPTLPGLEGKRYKSTVSDSVKRWATFYEKPLLDETFENYFDDDRRERIAVFGDGIQKYEGDTVTFKANYDIGEAQQSFFESGKFPDGANTYASSPDEAFDGMFYGVDGKYACPGCTFYNDGAGNLARIDGTLTFKPNDSTTVLERSTHGRQDYMLFGYWVTANRGPEGNWNYEFGTRRWAAPNIPWAYEDRNTEQTGEVYLTQGTATYTGSSVGMFVKQELSPHGAVSSTLAGEFVGDVNLTAYFGTAKGDVPENEKYTIRGTADNFRHNGELIDENWTLNLEKGLYVTQEKRGNVTYTYVNNAIRRSNVSHEGEAVGKWQGFFGGEAYNPVDGAAPVAPDPDNGIEGNYANQFPSYVFGDFDATLRNGKLSGVFGTFIDKE